jgi:hypothetical protein
LAKEQFAFANYSWQCAVGKVHLAKEQLAVGKFQLANDK